MKALQPVSSSDANIGVQLLSKQAAPEALCIMSEPYHAKSGPDENITVTCVQCQGCSELAPFWVCMARL